MPETSTLSLFVVAAALLVVVPGPNTLYIITRSAHQGLAAGALSCLGVMVGTLFHTAAAALGISALLLSSTTAFNLVKYAGAAYLVYLGIRTLRRGDDPGEARGAMADKGAGGTFFQGMLVNVLNPKTTLFIAAFLPQFVDAARGSVPGQILFFGMVLILIGAVSDLTYAFFAAKLGSRLRGDFRFPLQPYLAGCIYLGLGAAAALTGLRKP